MLQIAPHLVSRPGKDILEGVDALVKDGIADPDHLTVGGYSYGGYMTNWLITQTTRFKAAVTGAGAVEHAANWGNDDLTYDDAWYLGGARPWENPAIYQSEAALFQMNKVTTPTHIVGGNADVRVSYLEDVLLERALEQLQVPHSLLVFPVKDIHWTRIRGMATSRYGKSCGGWRSTAGGTRADRVPCQLPARLRGTKHSPDFF